MNESAPLSTRMHFLQTRVEHAMAQWLPAEEIHPVRLHKAMRYAALQGGKRLRPLLSYATGETLGVPIYELDGISSAVELIHSYSLVHDDLPAMDNDDLRRGKPTCHKAFDEATAILAGDALQALAFHIITHDTQLKASAEVRLRLIEVLALACGSRGMAGGQAIDLESVGHTLNLLQLEDMHIHKTGALIRACIVMAALCAPDVSETQFERLNHFGKCIGLAFQIHDDILDEVGETAKLGKQAGVDRANNKPTYASIAGLRVAKERAQDLYQEAVDALSCFDHRADLLRQIAAYVVERQY